MNRWYRLLGVFLALNGAALFCVRVAAQNQPDPAASALIQQAQTVQIPVTAVDSQTLLPVKELTASDFAVRIDGKPELFQLTRSSTDQPETLTNLLIILPFGDLMPRKPALEQAIDSLNVNPNWNISIFDDSGNQTAYTHDVKTAIAQLKRLETAPPSNISPEDWRLNATLAIASMRDLPGRRAVLSLGDIFHAILTDENQEPYEAVVVQDVASAAGNSGAVIYSANSAQEVALLRGLAPHDTLMGSGPWLLRMRNGSIAGWITDSVKDSLQKIQQDAAGAYDVNLHLDLNRMDGQLHTISVLQRTTGIILDAPAYFVAPDLARLRLLETLNPVLRHMLTTAAPENGSTPLELSTQLAYFPHSDGKTGTQIATTGYFWNAATPPPAHLTTALQLEQVDTGLIANTTVGHLQWEVRRPVWNDGMDVGAGAYNLRVAAADESGKIYGFIDTPFTVAPAANQPVLISSVVLGKTCVFLPPPSEDVQPAQPDYLRTGNCELSPDPTHYFSPQDVIWTLVRITPLGKLSGRPAKDWKASFAIVDADGARYAETNVSWLPASDGSYVATTAFPLSNPKLKLQNGEYAIAFRLRGPGIEDNYEQDVPFTVYNVTPETSSGAH